MPKTDTNKELAQDLIESGTAMVNHGNTLLRDAATVERCVTSMDNPMENVSRTERESMIRCYTTTEMYANRLIAQGQESIATGRRVLGKLVDKQGPKPHTEEYEG